MYYYSKKCRKKIIHTHLCFHIQHTELDDIGWFETLPEAYEQGYRLCKHCSPIAKHYRKESKQILDFCGKNGLAVHLGCRSIFVTSPRSKWKIAVGNDRQITLYHQNTFETERDHLSEIKGYHLQHDVTKDSVVEYLNYIVEHDYFRMLNPVYNKPRKKKESPPPRKGTRRYKSEQRRIEKYERKRAIRNVLNIIESLNIPQTVAASAVAM